MSDDRIEATYDYTDEDGNLLYQAVRLRDPKSFRQRVKAPKGSIDEWIWSLGETRRVPYKLSCALTAARAGRAVWIVEGEKDADALTALGFTATSSKNWHDEWCGFLKGAAFALIVADSDTPGRETAEKVAGQLKQAGVPVKVIDLAPQRDDGYDVSDFILEHGDAARAELAQVANGAKVWTGKKPPRLSVTTLGKFFETAERYDPTKDYLGPFLHGGYRNFVLGPTGHGKTTFVMEAVSAAACGTSFLGWRGKGVRVLYINLELGDELFRRALEDSRLNPTHENVKIVHRPLGLHLDTNPEHREMLENTIADFDIVILDPWDKIFKNVMDLDGSQRPVVAWLDGLRARHPRLCMILCHHTHIPANNKEPVTMANIRNFKFVLDQADLVVTFRRFKGNESVLRFEKNRSPLLDVTIGEEWALDWQRGHGFERDDKVPGQEELAV